MSSVRVRYGRTNDKQPKNTLVTVRVEDTLFFGIARCRISDDRPDKYVGKDLAALRCEVAADEPWKTDTHDGTFHLHRSGMLGCVNVDEKEKLLSYFRNIDEIQRSKSQSK
jgi:hypothetical protein